VVEVLGVEWGIVAVVVGVVGVVGVEEASAVVVTVVA
jgi:hypothetical protein